MSEPSQQAMRAAEAVIQRVNHPAIPWNAESLTEIIERETGAGEAAFLLRGFLDCLPQNRDWLDPDIERQARAYLSKHQP